MNSCRREIRWFPCRRRRICATCSSAAVPAAFQRDAGATFLETICVKGAFFPIPVMLDIPVLSACHGPLGAARLLFFPACIFLARSSFVSSQFFLSSPTRRVPSQADRVHGRQSRLRIPHSRNPTCWPILRGCSTRAFRRQFHRIKARLDCG